MTCRLEIQPSQRSVLLCYPFDLSLVYLGSFYEPPTKQVVTLKKKRKKELKLFVLNLFLHVGLFVLVYVFFIYSKQQQRMVFGALKFLKTSLSFNLSGMHYYSVLDIIQKLKLMGDKYADFIL